MPENIPRRYATIAHAADYTGFAEKTIRRRITDGSLTGYRFGKRSIRIDLNQLDELMRPIPTVGSAA